jgi:Flp pilus assembly pilin Flp
MKNNVAAFLSDSSGTAVAEYAMVGAFFGMMMIASLQMLGGTAVNVMTTAQVSFDNRNGVSP